MLATVRLSRNDAVGCRAAACRRAVLPMNCGPATSAASTHNSVIADIIRWVRSDCMSPAKRTGEMLDKVARLSRNAEFLLRLQNSNVDFVCCDCPNVDRFTVSILALVAQRERELISERTKSALQAARRRGVRLGTKNPSRQVKLMVAGYRRQKIAFVGKIRPIIDEIRSTGVSTLTGIADCLNRRGIPTRTGKSV